MLLTAAALVSCSEDPAAPPVARDRSLEIIPGASVDDLLDPVTVDSAWVDADTLWLAVSYGGGCEPHDFRAISNGSFMDIFSLPDGTLGDPILFIYLRHDGHGDACRSIVQEVLVFDITVARDLYRQRYGGDGLISLDVRAPLPPDDTQSTKALYHTGISDSPRTDIEAETMALILSGELTAPQELYEGIRSELSEIRAKYGDVMTANKRPLGDIRFWLHWEVSQLILEFEEPYLTQVREGRYTGWNDLNAALDLAQIDALVTRFFLLRFHGVLNTCRLIPLYRDLPGVTGATRNSLSGDSATIFPRETGSGRTYVFREAWGDCPAGCINQEYFYFVKGDEGYELVGKYAPPEPPPSWWDEADMNLVEYNELANCP
jgi:hypothetical protein